MTSENNLYGNSGLVTLAPNTTLSQLSLIRSYDSTSETITSCCIIYYYHDVTLTSTVIPKMTNLYIKSSLSGLGISVEWSTIKF